MRVRAPTRGTGREGRTGSIVGPTTRVHRLRRPIRCARMRRTKIVATIGPASREPETLVRMVEAGMDVAPLNYAHGTLDEHAETIRRGRDAAGRAGRPLAGVPGPPRPEPSLRAPPGIPPPTPRDSLPVT